MKPIRTLALLALALAVGCKGYVISHDEDKAADQAVRFGQAAFVVRDFKDAYRMLQPDLQKELPAPGFRDIVENIHPGGFPSVIEATDFEPVPGQESVQIFLEGRNGSSIFHYRFVMAGTSATGYRVAGMYRSVTPYPQSPLRQKLSRRAATS